MTHHLPAIPPDVRARLVECLTPLCRQFSGHPTPLDLANLLGSYLHAAGLELSLGSAREERRRRVEWSEEERKIRLRLEDAIAAHRQPGQDITDEDVSGMWGGPTMDEYLSLPESTRRYR